MSVFAAFIEGTRIRRDGEMAEPAANFAEPVSFHTGKAESEWVGPLLVALAAGGGLWHFVPWRMLRNEYMGYTPWQRLRYRWQKAPPPFYAEEPAVAWTMGAGRPPETLLVGLKDLIDHGLAVTTIEMGEVFFAPTDKLLACAVTADRPMTVERHLFPFGSAGIIAPEPYPRS